MSKKKKSLGLFTESESKRDQRKLSVNILALDIATSTGFCVRTTSGVWRFAPKNDESKGMRLIRLRAKLKEICEAEEIKLIVFEIIPVYGKFPNTVGIEMTGVMKLFCEDSGIDHKGYPPAVIQKFATGKGKGNKPLMIQTCIEKYGVTPETDDEADAIHLYHYAIQDLQL